MAFKMNLVRFHIPDTNSPTVYSGGGGGGVGGRHPWCNEKQQFLDDVPSDPSILHDSIGSFSKGS